MEIDIEVYKQSPATYTKPVCEQHEEIVDRACKKCDRLICVECDVYGTDCTGIIKYYPSDYYGEIKIISIYIIV